MDDRRERFSSRRSVERSLARIGDGGIEMIAAQAREIDREVEAATGFTFEQFRRTVLLAQGDVDAFLRARPKDRAAMGSCRVESWSRSPMK